MILSRGLADTGPLANLLGREAADASDTPAYPLSTNLIDSALGNDVSTHQHRDAVGERFGLFKVVRGEQHCATLPDQRANDSPQRLSGFDVEPGSGLIEKEQLGGTADRKSKLHPPLLATRKLAVGAVEKLANTRKTCERVEWPCLRVVAGGE